MADMSSVVRRGRGEMFSIRDPWAIRPAFYYIDDEIVALASERPVLQTTFDLECEDIKELATGAGFDSKQTWRVLSSADIRAQRTS